MEEDHSWRIITDRIWCHLLTLRKRRRNQFLSNPVLRKEEHMVDCHLGLLMPKYHIKIKTTLWSKYLAIKVFHRGSNRTTWRAKNRFHLTNRGCTPFTTIIKTQTKYLRTHTLHLWALDSKSQIHTWLILSRKLQSQTMKYKKQYLNFRMSKTLTSRSKKNLKKNKEWVLKHRKTSLKIQLRVRESRINLHKHKPITFYADQSDLKHKVVRFLDLHLEMWKEISSMIQLTICMEI